MKAWLLSVQSAEQITSYRSGHPIWLRPLNRTDASSRSTKSRCEPHINLALHDTSRAIETGPRLIKFISLFAAWTTTSQDGKTWITNWPSIAPSAMAELQLQWFAKWPIDTPLSRTWLIVEIGLKQPIGSDRSALCVNGRDIAWCVGFLSNLNPVGRLRLLLPVVVSTNRGTRDDRVGAYLFRSCQRDGGQHDNRC